jgi:FADH2 O2-dependent halogenase
VEPFDAVIDPPGSHGLLTPLSHATLHHLFHGGWIWVIPFDNHVTSTNRLCSVGLNLDPRVHPPAGLAPEEEFRRFIERYPAIRKQFARAVPIRDWISTDRLQFSSTRLVGDRYCLMPHAFTFVDPLFSSGLGISMGAINALGWRLIEAKRTGDWSTEHFAPVERRVKRDFGYFDRLVSRSYLAFSDFNLWNAWHRLWALASVYGTAGSMDVLGSYYRTGSTSAFMRFEEEPYDGIQAHRMPMLAAAFDAACREMDGYQEGAQSLETTVRRLYNVVSESGLWPEPWGALDRRQIGNLTMADFVRMMAWIRTKAPEYIRTRYFQHFQFREAAQMLGPELLGELGRMWRLGRAPTTGDWRYT